MTISRPHQKKDAKTTFQAESITRVAGSNLRAKNNICKNNCLFRKFPTSSFHRVVTAHSSSRVVNYSTMQGNPPPPGGWGEQQVTDERMFNRGPLGGEKSEREDKKVSEKRWAVPRKKRAMSTYSTTSSSPKLKKSLRLEQTNFNVWSLRLNLT